MNRRRRRRGRVAVSSRSPAPRRRPAQPPRRHARDPLAAVLSRCVAQRAAAGSPPVLSPVPLAGPVLQRYRSYSQSAGTPQGSYKIINGTHETFGDYHLKYHPIQDLDVFDEMHVKFDSLHQMIAATSNFPYFFFTDAGKLIQGKSQSGLQHLPAARDFAQEVVDKFLESSPVVSQEEYEKRVQTSEASKAAIAANTKWTDKWAAEDAVKAELAMQAEQQKLEAAKQSQDEEIHMANFVKDTNSAPLAGFKACVENAPNAATYGWLHKKAEWYRNKQKTGWTLTAATEPRLKKPKTPDVSEIRKAEGWPAEADVKVSARPSGQFRVFTITADLKNYTRWATTPAAKKELAALG